MSTTGIHYHWSTGHDSKNRGSFYICQNKRTSAAEGCCHFPSWRKDDFEGRDLFMVIEDYAKVWK